MEIINKLLIIITVTVSLVTKHDVHNFKTPLLSPTNKLIFHTLETLFFLYRANIFMRLTQLLTMGKGQK